MKRVLILAYDFPPFVSVGGLRPYNWFKYLKQFDIYPVVVTRQWENKHGSELDYISHSKTNKVEKEKDLDGVIIRAPYFPNVANKILLKYGDQKFKLIRKLISGFYEFFQYVLPIGSKRELYKAANEYLKNNKVDVIIATGDPFVLFHYATKLSKRYKTPWLADYRDPWSHDISNSKNPILKYWYRYHEKIFLKSAKEVITVSHFVADKIHSLNNKFNIKIITNGYDPELVDKYASLPQSHDLLTITYAGSIYDWHPLHLFWNVINESLIDFDFGDFQLKFIGINNKEKHEQYLKSNLPELYKRTKFINRVPNSELLKHLANSNILLLFNYYSFMGTKIYDYLGINRKILFCFTDDPEALKLKEKHYNIDESDSPNHQLQEDLIKTTNSGILVKDQQDLKNHLRNLILEFDQKRMISNNSKNIEQFSRKLQVEKLANIIKNLNK